MKIFVKQVIIGFATMLIVTLSISSCGSLEEPTVLRIEDVEVLEMNKERIDMNASMVIMNPNSVALDLSSADLDVITDDIIIAKIKQNYDLSMPANAEFDMPINISMDLNKLYRDNPLAALGKGLQIISEKQLEVLLKGNIKAGKGVAKITIPVEQKELVKF